MYYKALHFFTNTAVQFAIATGGLAVKVAARILSENPNRILTVP